MVIAGVRNLGSRLSIPSQPGGLTDITDLFLSYQTNAFTASASAGGVRDDGDAMDLSNYKEFEIIAFLTADTNTPTEVAVVVEKDLTDDFSGAEEEVDGEMQIESGDLQANGRSPVSNVYTVDPDSPWVRATLRHEDGAGTATVTMTIMIRGLGRRTGDNSRFLTEGEKVGALASVY